MEGTCYGLRRKRSPSPNENHPPAKKQKPIPSEVSDKGSPLLPSSLAIGLVTCKQRPPTHIKVTAAQSTSSSTVESSDFKQVRINSSSTLGSLMATGSPLPVYTPPSSQSTQGTSDSGKRGMVMAASVRQEQAIAVESCSDEKRFIELRDQLLHRQRKYGLDPKYMSRHPDLNWAMRGILIDWLIEVCGLHKYCRQTLHLCVINFDRYMSRVEDIPPNRLQLVGCASLFIAAKMEEVTVPHAASLAYLTEGGCTAQQILECEQHILKVLDFEILPVTPNVWADLLVDRCITTPTKHLSVAQLRTILIVQVMQIIDLAILDKESLTFPPHLLAAAACHCASHCNELSLSLGVSWSVLGPVSEWVSPIITVLSGCRITPSDQPHVQQHICGLALLDSVAGIRTARAPRPLTPANSEGSDTPPANSGHASPVTPSSDCNSPLSC